MKKNRSAFSLFNPPFVLPEDIRATFRPRGDEPKMNVKAQPVASVNNLAGILTDLVHDSKLDTRFVEDGGVVHVSFVSTPGLRRKERKEERWKSSRILARGSFGRVWLQECTHDNGSKSFRAVKEIFKQKVANEEKPIDYTRELEAIAKFSHTKYVYCFVESFGWYESGSAIFITMEYMENGDLQEYLSVPFPEAEVKEIASQLLEGLTFMHENGFAHRDLKPANVLVSKPSPNWWVKISDFGISKRAQEASTVFHTVVGTNGYLAPEVMGYYSPDDDEDNDSPYTVAVDLWALGALTFRLLTNQNIFTEPRMLGRYVVGRAPFPKTLLTFHAVSEACICLLEKMMAPSPLKRPTAVEALEDAWICDDKVASTSQAPSIGNITR
ncbi:unnamed protein product [Clonostachys solani]|uniref:Protein kinase domain-containing protein n=1 Tax=Clonostachys solani TaxID=160281 RepID=A0A9P0EKR6_9HYPO|nr:unnamed protein product [Clonostachys solani]